MDLWSLTCAVYQRVSRKKGTNIQTLVGKTSLHVMVKMNKDLAWKFQPLISSQSERSCRSVFVIYNDLSDSSPSGKNGGAVRDEIMVPKLCMSENKTANRVLAWLSCASLSNRNRRIMKK